MATPYCADTTTGHGMMGGCALGGYQSPLSSDPPFQTQPSQPIYIVQHHFADPSSLVRLSNAGGGTSPQAHATMYPAANVQRYDPRDRRYGGGMASSWSHSGNSSLSGSSMMPPYIIPIYIPQPPPTTPTTAPVQPYSSARGAQEEGLPRHHHHHDDGGNHHRVSGRKSARADMEATAGADQPPLSDNVSSIELHNPYAPTPTHGGGHRIRSRPSAHRSSSGMAAPSWRLGLGGSSDIRDDSIPVGGRRSASHRTVRFPDDAPRRHFVSVVDGDESGNGGVLDDEGRGSGAKQSAANATQLVPYDRPSIHEVGGDDFRRRSGGGAGLVTLDQQQLLLLVTNIAANSTKLADLESLLKGVREENSTLKQSIAEQQGRLKGELSGVEARLQQLFVKTTSADKLDANVGCVQEQMKGLLQDVKQLRTSVDQQAVKVESLQQQTATRTGSDKVVVHSSGGGALVPPPHVKDAAHVAAAPFGGIGVSSSPMSHPPTSFAPLSGPSAALIAPGGAGPSAAPNRPVGGASAFGTPSVLSSSKPMAPLLPPPSVTSVAPPPLPPPRGDVGAAAVAGALAATTNGDGVVGSHQPGVNPFSSAAPPPPSGPPAPPPPLAPTTVAGALPPTSTAFGGAAASPFGALPPKATTPQQVSHEAAASSSAFGASSTPDNNPKPPPPASVGFSFGAHAAAPPTAPSATVASADNSAAPSDNPFASASSASGTAGPFGAARSSLSASGGGAKPFASATAPFSAAAPAAAGHSAQPFGFGAAPPSGGPPASAFGGAQSPPAGGAPAFAALAAPAVGGGPFGAVGNSSGFPAGGGGAGFGTVGGPGGAFGSSSFSAPRAQLPPPAPTPGGPFGAPPAMHMGAAMGGASPPPPSAPMTGAVGSFASPFGAQPVAAPPVFGTASPPGGNPESGGSLGRRPLSRAKRTY